LVERAAGQDPGKVAKLAYAPMNNDDEYRGQAKEAERQARLARNDADRESWLRIAQGWMSLLSKRPGKDERAFNTESKAKGTGQDDSESSH
jgi:hypothetical protein